MIDYGAVFANLSGAFPGYVADNVSAPGAGDGTEFVKALIDDEWGRAQALLDYAGLTPDGVQEAPDTAQMLTAIKRGFVVGPGIIQIYMKNDTPVAKGDRCLLLQGQVITIATYPLLVAETYCGDANNGTAPAFYKTSDAGGTTRDTAGAYFVLPDARGLSLKNIGDATISGRTKTGPVSLGEVQEDQFQGHWHDMVRETVGGANRSIDTNTSGNTSISDDLVVKNTARTPSSDVVNGTPRTGDATRDSTLGVNFAITY